MVRPLSLLYRREDNVNITSTLVAITWSKVHRRLFLGIISSICCPTLCSMGWCFPAQSIADETEQPIALMH
tara:strand:+ start:227 stop:439 length:213 start_codon:yes stop_codon:yes gene_type:complete